MQGWEQCRKQINEVVILSKGIDWIKIRNEYINGNISYRKLAEKYSMSFSTLSRRAIDENWQELRKKQRNKIETKIRQKTADKKVDAEVDRLTRILNVSDKLLTKAEQAISELDIYFVTNKEKTELIEYRPNAKSKKDYEKKVVYEYEKAEKLEGSIDRLGVKLLAAALKDILTVQTSNRADEQTLIKLDEILRGIDNAAK